MIKLAALCVIVLGTAAGDNPNSLTHSSRHPSDLRQHAPSGGSMSEVMTVVASTLLTQMPPANPPEASSRIVAGDGIVIVLRFGSSKAPRTPVKSQGVRKEAELKWVKRTADDFLTAVLNENGASARALLTGEAARMRLDTLRVPTPFGQSGRIYYLEKGQVKTTGSGGFDSSIPIHLLRSFKIDSDEASPDGDEYSFRGTFEGYVQASFALRLVKEKDSAKWRVIYFVITSFKPPEAEKPGQPK
jgi:hypothetical protein